MSEFPKIISVDDHVVEPANVWVDRLPSKYLDIGPRIVRAPVKEISFVGGKFVAVKGEKGDEGPVADWWLYEDLVRPLVRVDSAVGVDRGDVTMRGGDESCAVSRNTYSASTCSGRPTPRRSRHRRGSDVGESVG